MLRSALCLALAALLTGAAVAQEKPAPKLSAGLEQDFLPYVTGGYFAGVWVGKGHLRGRALTARVHLPNAVVQDGFTNNWVTSYALLADYFFKSDWKGFWMGAGPVYWKSSIQSDARTSTVHYENLLLNGSAGYSFPFLEHFYLSPWAGLSLRLTGDRHFTVDGRDFTAPLVNPEVSVKVGWRFK